MDEEILMTPEELEREGLYACTFWTIEDLKCIEDCENWSDARCRAFLEQCKHQLVEKMIDVGWDVLFDELEKEF